MTEVIQQLIAQGENAQIEFKSVDVRPVADTGIDRERFDYTRWRQQQWQGETVASLAAKARKMREANAVSR
jgi:hypothetical protein